MTGYRKHRSFVPQHAVSLIVCLPVLLLHIVVVGEALQGDTPRSNSWRVYQAVLLDWDDLERLLIFSVRGTCLDRPQAVLYIRGV